MIGGGLAAFGINELTLIVIDADGNNKNGFQVVTDSQSGGLIDLDNAPGFQLSLPSEESLTLMQMIKQ